MDFHGKGGLRLIADAWGDPGAAPVLLLHGGGQTRYAWGGTARALARAGWYAISLDLRGHGESDWDPDGDYSAEAFVEDFLGVSSGLARRPAVVGASLGGITALLAEGESAGGICSALVLVDIVPKMEPEGVERIVGFMRAAPDGFASVQEAADAIASYLPHRARPRDLSGLRKNLRRHDDGRYRWHWDPRFLSGHNRLSAARDPDRLRTAARALRVPTLLVRGRMSELVSEDGAREFIELVPHARYVDVSRAGHMVAGDRNDVFSEAVIDFLEGFRESGSA
ncbi:MAG: alpha/beta fold hydrolase [Deltaproteobacteria bacterium]|nr:MAG: alpha/beta fold hydrolase [Deltaproteobacteria bacterium]